MLYNCKLVSANHLTKNNRAFSLVLTLMQMLAKAGDFISTFFTTFIFPHKLKGF